MAQVGGDVMIANASMLAMSAYDDSYTNEALDLIPGNMAKTLVERTGRAVVGTYRASDPTKGINGAIDSEVPLAQVGDEGQIYYADFKNSIAVKTLPGGGMIYPGGICNEISQVNFFDWATTALSWIDKQVVGNLALLGVFGAETGKGGIYSFGRKDKNHPFALNCEYQFDADEIGAVANVDGTTIFSYRIGSTYGVMAVDSQNKAVGTYVGIHFMPPVKESIQLYEWKQVEIKMKKLPAGCSVEFWYKYDDVDDYTQAFTADGKSSFSSAGANKATFRLGGNGDIYEPMVILRPNNNNETPEIFRIKTLFT
jgi:hypothetical protein